MAKAASYVQGFSGGVYLEEFQVVWNSREQAWQYRITKKERSPLFSTDKEAKAASQKAWAERVK